MKYLYLSIIGLFLAVNAQAQNASFKWSEWSKNANVGLQNPTLVFPTNSGFTVYSIEEAGTQVFAPKIIYITKFDDSCNSLSTLDFDLPKRMQRDATLLKVIEGNGKLYFFSYLAVKKDAKNVLYAQVYDNVAETISDIIEVYALPIEKVNNSGFFEVAISEDRNTLSVLVNKPFVKKDKESIEILVLDAELNSVSNSDHTFSFESERAYREELFVENDATVTIIKKTDIFKKEPITTVITVKDSKLIEQKISSEEFYISDNKVITINNKQYLLGFATDNAKPAVSMGGAKDKSFFIYNISDQKLIKNQGWSPEILKKVLGNGFIDLKIKDVLVNNNDIYLIGDRFTKTSKAIEGASFQYDYTYNFGPGVVVKLNVNGDVAYDTYIKYSDEYKNSMERLGSFYPFLKDGELHILANEKESVLKEKKIVLGYNKINAKAIVLNKFDASGNITVTPFWESKVGGEDIIIDFAPTKTRQFDNSMFYIYAYGNKYQSFGKITIE